MARKSLAKTRKVRRRSNKAVRRTGKVGRKGSKSRRRTGRGGVNMRNPISSMVERINTNRTARRHKHDLHSITGDTVSQRINELRGHIRLLNDKLAQAHKELANLEAGEARFL